MLGLLDGHKIKRESREWACVASVTVRAEPLEKNEHERLDI